MIKGIGCDIVDLNRLKLENDKFVLKILTPNEYQIYVSKKTIKQKREFLGGRFAAKEAYFKAYGIRNNLVSFHDIEIVNDKLGKPVINQFNTHLSIAHENDYAIAYIIIED